MRDQAYPVPQPIVLGHEGSGIVIEVGAAATKVKPGGPRCDDLQLVWPLRKLPGKPTN
jgi:hypothetical protein